MSVETRTYTITCRWDEEARVWYVEDSDVPGLVTEAATAKELYHQVIDLIPELLSANGQTFESGQQVPVELLMARTELVSTC